MGRGTDGGKAAVVVLEGASLEGRTLMKEVALTKEWALMEGEAVIKCRSPME